MRDVCSFVSIVMGDAGMSNRAWEVDGVPILGLTVLLVLGGRCHVASCLFPGDMVCIKDGCDNLSVVSKSR